MFEEKLVNIIEATLIDDLSEKLTRRLGEVTIELGHVHVIDEKDHLLASFRLEHVLPESI